MKDFEDIPSDVVKNLEQIFLKENIKQKWTS